MAKGSEIQAVGAHVTLDEAARRIGVSRKTIERLIADGQLVKVRLSPARVGIRASDIDEYLERQRVISPLTQPLTQPSGAAGDPGYMLVVQSDLAPEDAKKAIVAAAKEIGLIGAIGTTNGIEPGCVGLYWPSGQMKPDDVELALIKLSHRRRA